MDGTEIDSYPGNAISILEPRTEGAAYSLVTIPDEVLNTPEFCLAALRSIQRIIRNGLADRSPYQLLELSMQSQKVMQRTGMNTFAELLSQSRKDLLAKREHGFTKIMVREIEEQLATWGLQLAEGH